MTLDSSYCGRDDPKICGIESRRDSFFVVHAHASRCCEMNEKLLEKWSFSCIWLSLWFISWVNSSKSPIFVIAKIIHSQWRLKVPLFKVWTRNPEFCANLRISTPLFVHIIPDFQSKFNSPYKHYDSGSF